MSLSKNEAKKYQKKIRRCQILISNEVGIKFSDVPTENIIVCNAGLATGLQQETLLKEMLCHGNVKSVAFPTGKSYCYVNFESAVHAEQAYLAIHGIATLGQDAAVLLLAYCREFPEMADDSWTRKLPPGLTVIHSFVTEELERILLNEIDWNDEDEPQKSTLKHRKVKHYGYQFLYGTNNIDRSKPLNRKIPICCEQLWAKIQTTQPDLTSFVPEQLTVNRYEPGQGIPPHVDTHSAFEDPILSLSLGSDVVMDFRDEAGNQVCIDLPKRSLLIMSGESRYGWTHGITPRKMDTIPSAGGGLTVRERKLRVSFTFRKLHDGPCHCQFVKFCDTQQKKSVDLLPTTKVHAAQLEEENVHRVYNVIAKHFSETRHSPWPKVAEFVNAFEPASILLDVGCGNGKYLGLNNTSLMLGCDRSESLLQVCRERGHSVFQCDCLAVPIRDGSVDACISIAVIHHLATEERRQHAIKEMVRVLQPGGKALIYVWAKNQEANAIKSSYLRQNKQNNKRDKQQNTIQEKTNSEIPEEAGKSSCKLPVHTNRTPFEHQDLLVPWKLRSKSNDASQESTVTFLRYYHVFEENELEKLCMACCGSDIRIVTSYYDQGNWCVILEKERKTIF